MQAVAQPGSGKTLGYLLPGAERLHEAGHGPASRPDGPAMLILTPTRHVWLTCRVAYLAWHRIPAEGIVWCVGRQPSQARERKVSEVTC